MNKNTEITEDILDIVGSGGKGGGSTFTEQNNTLRSNARVKVINVISEGEIEGIAGGARGLYFNNTNLENADGVRNIPKVEWDWRPGLPSQTPMSGFPGAVNVVTVNTNVTNASPVVRTVSATSIDAVRVVLSFTAGLMEQDTGDGSLRQTSVQYALDRRAASGSWQQVGSNIELIEKVNSPFQKSYLIDRPNGSTGLWDYRVRRVSADNVASNIKNDFQLSNVAEIQNKSQAYENTAVVGLSLLAESFGGQIPKVGFLVKGLLLDIPSNYNPATRVYTGIWNGVFVKSSIAIDNPAWVLYNLITNERWGAGEILGANSVDPYSFYSAAVYCDELVPNGSGGLEPRFTFNFPVSSRDVGLRLINSIAGMMRGRLISVGGLWTIVQDRPASVSHAFNNTNVVDGLFSYSSSSLTDRHTAFNVTYQDKADLYAPKILTVDSSTISAYASTYATALAAAENKYGYELAEIVAYGSTTEGQAIRAGLWTLDTELNQTELVTFKTGTRNGAALMPNQIIEVYDEDFVQQAGAGRVISSSGTSVTLDRPVTLVSGSKIKVLLADGVTLEERNIVQTTGTLSTITVTVAFSQALHEDAVFTVSHAYSARQFRILSIKQDSETEVSVEAVFHDPNKYARIETNVSIPTAPFAPVVASRTGPVGTLSFTRADVQNSAEGLNGIRRSLNVSWAPPSLGQAVKYVGQWKHETGNWIEFETRVQNFTIDPAYPGTYTITVAAVSASKIVGPFVTGTSTIDVNGSGASSLNPPTSLVVTGGGTNFSGLDLNFTWTNPSSNISTLGTLRDFEVKFIETTGGTTVRTVYVDPVAAGSTQSLMYTYAMNTVDGGPRRSIQVQVRCRDSKNNLSSPVTATFTNPTPSVPPNIAVIGALGSNKITYDLPNDADYQGVLVWRSTTSGFTPNSTNLIYDGSDSYIADNALTANTTYYYRLAAYDAFSKSSSGTGMNLSAQYSATTVSNGGIASGSANPGTAAQGDLFFNTSDNKLYRYTGSSWTAAVPSTDVTGTLADAQIAAVAAAKVTGQLVDSQIAAIGAAKVTGTLTASQLNVTIGGGNLLANSRFNGRAASNTAPYGWGTYNGGGIAATIVASTGRTGSSAYGFQANAAGTSTFGVLTGNTIVAGGVTGGIEGGWQPTATYIISFYAKKVNGASWTNMRLGWNTNPTTTVDLSNPTLSTLYQRYAFKITTGASPEAQGRLYISTTGNTASGDEIHISDVQVEQGDLLTAYSPRPLELLLPGTITATEIADNAITSPKIIAGAVTAGKIGADAVTATTIAAGAVTTAKLAAGAVTANEIAAGAVTASKLVVTSKGQAINDDPAFEDTTAWTLLGTGSTFGTGVTGINNAVGNKYVANSTGGSNGQLWSREIAVDPTKTYLLTANLYAASGNDRNMYIFVDMYDSAGAQVTGATTGWGGSLSGYVFGGTTPQNQFTRQGAQFGAGTPRLIPANVRTIKVGVWFQYSGSGTTAVQQACQDLRLERVNDGQLIVDGAITALKIAANTIVAGNIQAGTITGTLLATGTVTATQIAADTITGFHIVANSVSGDKIVANSIVAGKIAASTITGDKIAGTTITGANLVANTITGDKVAAGTITATNIDSRNLTIKDGSGNVIFSAGVPLTATYADAALKNSSITLSDATGAINGIGTGSGTSVANNTDSVIRAPGGGVYTNASGTVTGALKIRLPQWFTDSMIRFTIEIYEYSTGYMATIEVGGYNYSSSLSWLNVSARVLGGSNVEYPVYFGHDGTKACIWVDGPAATWSYPQVRVRDVLIGYSNYSKAQWESGWQISFDTAFTNVGGTGTNQYSTAVTDTLPGADWSKTARRPANVAALSGSESINNAAVTIASNGTLSGAGGGQVTIGGLGYTGDLNASSDLVLTNGGGVSINGNKVTKTSGSGSWDAGAWSRDGYLNGAYASAKFGNSGQAMFGLNTDPTSDNNYTSLDFAVYWVGDGRVQIYEGGSYKAEPLGTGVGQLSDVFTVMYDGRSVFYYQNGTVIYQHGVSVSSPLYFDCSIASNTAFLTNCRFGPVTTNTSTNLIDSRTWAVGTSGNQPGFVQNPVTTGGANYITVDTLPNSDMGVLWRAQSGTGGSSEGGWNGANFPIDNTKMYRFSVWIRAMKSGGGAMSGSFYLGCGPVNNLGGTLNTNAYFYNNNRTTIVDGAWYLIVGYVYPSSYGGSTNIGGIYRASTGQKIASSVSYRWPSDATTSYHRAYQYYSTTNTDYQDFWAPRVDVCDGAEPSIDELLAVGSVSARNPITSGTASTYIASAAINLAQINTASIGSLSALTATIGTLRTATSGARTEIADNVIRVYDSSNVLRVKIGNLS